MATQVENGRAFEWAVGQELSRQTQCLLEKSKFSELAQECFDQKISESKRAVFTKAASAAVTHILKKEQKNISNSLTRGLVKFNSDKAGAAGDVRDVMLVLPTKTLGISCKNNHSALKHSRLSSKLNFVEKWAIDANGCSAQYLAAVKRIFDELKTIRANSNGAFLWEDLDNKAGRFYWPVLDAWALEIQRICNLGEQQQSDLCRAILTYLVGKHDFYKVICEGSEKVQIQAWNFNGSLSTKRTKYPDIINAINNKNGSQYSKTIVFNRGYSLNFRIHNASSKVEASLKFDINAIGLPPNEVEQQTLFLND